VEATLRELQQNTEKLIAAVENGETVTITERGKPKARLVPVAKRDKVGAAKALMAIGPITFLPRK
jgi:prevent-host-death family protein